MDKFERGEGRVGYRKDPGPAKLEKWGFEKDLRVEEILSKIDFTTIRQLYAELFTKSGADVRKMNFIGPERVYVTAKENADLSYDKDVNVITINKKLDGSMAFGEGPPPFLESLPNLDEFYAAPDISNTTFRNIESVFRIIHEEGHAISSIRGDVSGLFARTFKTDVGYLHHEHKESLFGPDFDTADFFGHVFNEGVTQLLALEVLERYAHRKGVDDFGTSASDFEKYTSCFNNDVYQIGFSYKPDVEFVRIFIEFLSAVAETPRNAIWNGIVRGYIQGGDLFDEDILAAFRDHGITHLMEAFKEYDATISRLDRAVTPGKTSERNKALQAANKHLYDMLPPSSHDYLNPLFNDFSGSKFKTLMNTHHRHRNWIPYSEMRELYPDAFVEPQA